MGKLMIKMVARWMGIEWHVDCVKALEIGCILVCHAKNTGN